MLLCNVEWWNYIHKRGYNNTSWHDCDSVWYDLSVKPASFVGWTSSWFSSMAMHFLCQNASLSCLACFCHWGLFKNDIVLSGICFAFSLSQHVEETLKWTRLKVEPMLSWVTPDSRIMFIKACGLIKLCVVCRTGFMKWKQQLVKGASAQTVFRKSFWSLRAACALVHDHRRWVTRVGSLKKDRFGDSDGESLIRWEIQKMESEPQSYLV